MSTPLTLDPSIRFWQRTLVPSELRCPDCWKLTSHAARAGLDGSYCDCPFDKEHP